MGIQYRKLIDKIESKSLKSSLPRLDVGDTVRIGVLIQEGNKERIQPYEGTIIAKRNSGFQ
eukprot:jgi/Botrbrau1/11375/Bobra.0151s0002.1